MHCFEEKTLLRIFLPPSDSAPGALRPPCYSPGLTLCNKVRSCEICRVLNVRPLFLIERTQLKLSHVSRMPNERLCWLNPWESDSVVVQNLGGIAAPPTLLGPILVWSQQNYLKLLLTVRYSKFSFGCWPRNPPLRKSRQLMSEQVCLMGRIDQYERRDG